MNFPWAICLLRKDAGTLATLRLQPGVEVAEAGDLVWLRGQAGNEELTRKLSALPARTRYECLSGQRLRELEKRIPTGQLPVVIWQPLAAWLQVEFPPAAWPAAPPQPVRLQLVRSGEEREPELLLTSLEEWSRFALTAARARLDGLRFAVDNSGRVLILGRPLPSLPGQHFAMHNHIAIPAGYAWQPAVGADVLLRLFGVAKGSLVLWQEDGKITRLVAEQFVPATRSAIPATRQLFAENT